MDQKAIKSREDIETLVRAFYTKVLQDDLLAVHFKDVDWERHFPVMFNFWSSLILGDRTYQGNPFQKHAQLPLGVQHFDRWLQLFHETVNEQFSGEKAEEIKFRASSIAGVFQHRMGINVGKTYGH